MLVPVLQPYRNRTLPCSRSQDRASWRVVRQGRRRAAKTAGRGWVRRGGPPRAPRHSRPRRSGASMSRQEYASAPCRGTASPAAPGVADADARYGAADRAPRRRASASTVRTVPAPSASRGRGARRGRPRRTRADRNPAVARRRATPGGGGSSPCRRGPGSRSRRQRACAPGSPQAAGQPGALVAGEPQALLQADAARQDELDIRMDRIDAQMKAACAQAAPDRQGDRTAADLHRRGARQGIGAVRPASRHRLHMPCRRGAGASLARCRAPAGILR